MPIGFSNIEGLGCPFESYNHGKNFVATVLQRNNLTHHLRLVERISCRFLAFLSHGAKRRVESHRDRCWQYWFTTSAGSKTGTAIFTHLLASLRYIRLHQSKCALG